jgi:hypothetical protein
MNVDPHDSPAGWLLQGGQGFFVFVGAGLPANVGVRGCTLTRTIYLYAYFLFRKTPVLSVQYDRAGPRGQ